MVLGSVCSMVRIHGVFNFGFNILVMGEYVMRVDVNIHSKEGFTIIDDDQELILQVVDKSGRVIAKGKKLSSKITAKVAEASHILYGKYDATAEIS